MRKIALIAGASGAVGSALLAQLITHKDYQKLHLIVRRPIPDLPDHCIQHVRPDFTLESLSIADTLTDIFCCLGTTIKIAGSKAAFKAVDHDLITRLCDWGRRHKIPAFHLVSSNGARAKSPIFYLSVKGQTEDHCITAGYDQLTVVRPALLYGADRPDFRMAEKLSLPLLRLLCAPPMLKKWRPVRVQSVAKAMIEAADQQTAGVTIIESQNL